MKNYRYVGDVSLIELLQDCGFEIGKIDPTLFTKRVKGDLFICQLYIDDIFLVLLTNLSMMSLPHS